MSSIEIKTELEIFTNDSFKCLLFELIASRKKSIFKLYLNYLNCRKGLNLFPNEKEEDIEICRYIIYSRNKLQSVFRRREISTLKINHAIL